MAESALQEIVCCFGQPVAGNPTQFMMESAFAKAGLEWRYLTLEVGPEDLPAAVAGLLAMGFRGGNLTIPHKVAVLEHLDRLTEAAELIGAVNCIIEEDGALVGDNTDGKGFVESLRPLVDPKDKRVVMFGAGGAARAIAVESALAGASHFTIVNRDPTRAESLLQTINDRTDASATFVEWDHDYQVPEESDILINATSIGLGDPDGELRVAFDSMRSSQVVADVIFNPPQTRWLQHAQDAGCQTLDGLGMLVNQGAIAFKSWTGVDPDVEVMREALEEYLEL